MSGSPYRGVPYGVPHYSSPDDTSNFDQYGLPRQESHDRQGLPSQQYGVLNNNTGGPRNNGSHNFSRGPARSPESSQQWPLPNSRGPEDADVQFSQTRGPHPDDQARHFGNILTPQQQQQRLASNRIAHDDHPIPQYANAEPVASSVFSEPGVWSDNGYDSPSNYPSPNSMRPFTGDSMVSTSSSYYASDAPPPLPSALPPLPANHLQARQHQQHQYQQHMLPPKSPRDRIPLGPPPSSRRGPSSYYSQPTYLSHVTPIVEESDGSNRDSFLRSSNGSRGSYASSNAIPIGVPDYYMNDAGTPVYNRSNVESYASRSEYDDSDFPLPPMPVAMPDTRQGSPVLVRQASLGKRSKPTLTTITPSENPKHGATRGSAYIDDSFRDGSQMMPPVQRPQLGRSATSETSFYDRSSSDSERSDYMKYQNKEYFYEPMPDRIPRQPTTYANEPRVESILDRLEKAGALPQAEDLPDHLNHSQRVGTERSPLSKVDAVREADQRSSLTSLPDLIRRATRLASNLDRGKTASRLGLDWILNDEKSKGYGARYRSGSLTDMISAFPPPAPRSPRASGRFTWPANRHSLFPSYSNDRGGNDGSRPKKRVCGMPIWVFLLLLFLVILLIAAAVIVPVVLIVIPRQSQNNVQSLESCKQRLTCLNGGVNVLGSDDGCRCLCVNGFTGSTCNVEEGPSCASLSVPGAPNATVGDSLPRLFDAAETNFSIPLNGPQILSLFAATNLSCSSENSLITFGGQSERRSIILDEAYFAATPDVTEVHFGGEEDTSPTKTLQERQVTTTVVSSQAAATSNGIVFAVGGPAGSTPTNSPNNTSPEELDFARVAVLFVLQDSGQLNEAIAAQSSFQKWFSGQAAPGAASTNITLQNGYSANINTGQVVVKNGTRVGPP